MNNWHRLKHIFYTALILVYLINVFVGSEKLNYAVGLLVIGSIAVSFQGAKRIYRILASIFLAAGLILFTFTEISWVSIPSYMTSTVLLLSLLYVLPFINSVFKIGRYDQDIRKLLKVRMEHYGQLYYRTSFVSYLLSIFLFFGALPLVFDVIQKNLSGLNQTFKNKFVSRAILRGFAMAAIWSPVEILVALTAEITGVHYLTLLPWLLLLSALYISIDWVTGWKYRSVLLIEHKNAVPMDWAIIRKITVLAVALVIFIVVAVAFHKWVGISFFTAITVIVVPYSLLWSLLLKRLKGYLRYSLRVWKHRTPSLHNMMLLFLSLGFFNSMFGETSFLEMLRHPFLLMADKPVLLFVFIQILSICLPLVGFHPLVTISLFGIFVQPLLGMINPVSIAIVLLSSSLATASAGTYNTTVTIMSGLLNVNPYRITLWNFAFALLYGGLGTVLAVLLL